MEGERPCAISRRFINDLSEETEIHSLGALLSWTVSAGKIAVCDSFDEEMPGVLSVNPRLRAELVEPGREGFKPRT